MRLTKRFLTSVCPVAILATPLALSIAPAFAQSTGTMDVETVVVTGSKAQLNGLMNAAPISKERSVITSEFLQTQTSGQTVFQALNFMPGINFTNNDPYGSSGGDIRMHGQDGNHISLTLDGMPLNDTGNYAIYTNQMLDPEVVDRVSANQGATDVDSPTAAATGGVINIESDKPHDEFGAMGSVSVGQFDRQRYFGRIDTGQFGNGGPSAFATLSYQDYDKFKGPGEERKLQGNVKVYQDFGSAGWFSLAGHWNTNRNNSYYAEDYQPNTTGFSTTAPAASAGKIPFGGANPATADLIKNPSGDGYIQNPLWSSTTSGFSGTGWDRDYQNSCVYNRTGSNSNSGTITTAPVAGTTDYTETTCTNFYKVRINPSDTGNLRFHSLWHLLDSLTLTADANLQYVLANGGGYTSVAENDARLKGATTGTGTTTTAYGCIAGQGCDLNGDGDVKDTVALYSPSTTNTRRWGFSSSLIYELMEGQTFQLAYTLDYGLHRQTGQMTRFDAVNGPWSPFGGMKDRDHAAVSADGLDIRSRDRKSKAIMNQVAFDWESSYFDGMLQTNFGFRDPFFERDLNQYCYEQVGSSTVLCTSQPIATTNADGSVQFAGNSTHYVMPGHAVKRYNRFLPHTGVTFMPFGKEHQFFATYVQEMAAPRTDNLYVGGVDPSTGKVGIVASSLFADGNYHTTLPETSATYQLGYRFLGEDLQAALVLWNSQVKNRIVSSYDPNTGNYFDHNVPGVNFTGVDFEANYQFDEALSAYFNAGYDHARITSNIQVQKNTVAGVSGIPVGSPLYAQTLNKQLTETPKWTFAGRTQYKITPEFIVGLEGKYVSKRYASEDNNASVPDYFTFAADVTYDLDKLGMEGSSIQLNADNIFNKHYFGSIAGTQTCWTPTPGYYSNTVGGCTSYPYMYEGSPRTISATLVVRY